MINSSSDNLNIGILSLDPRDDLVKAGELTEQPDLAPIVAQDEKADRAPVRLD
jgi:hypothetical protein